MKRLDGFFTRLQHVILTKESTMERTLYRRLVIFLIVSVVYVYAIIELAKLFKG